MISNYYTKGLGRWNEVKSKNGVDILFKNSEA